MCPTVQDKHHHMPLLYVGASLGNLEGVALALHGFSFWPSVQGLHCLQPFTPKLTLVLLSAGILLLLWKLLGEICTSEIKGRKPEGGFSAMINSKPSGKSLSTLSPDTMI